MLNVAFDVDGTLIDSQDKPRDDVMRLLMQHFDAGDKVYVWSGGGMDYARRWVDRLCLGRYVTNVLPKTASYSMDVAYDDQSVTLAKNNIRV